MRRRAKTGGNPVRARRRKTVTPKLKRRDAPKTCLNDSSSTAANEDATESFDVSSNRSDE